MSNKYDRSCLTCQHFTVGTLAHVEGFMLVVDYANVPICMHPTLQTGFVKQAFPRKVQQIALENLPLPIPVDCVSHICGMKYWRKKLTEGVKQEVNQ